MPATAEELYAWHERPGAFERLTPPWERVRVLRAAPIANGAMVTLEIRVAGFPVRWIARHREVIPGRQFADEQVEGPFESWVHTRRMTPLGPDACELDERVEFVPPLGALGGVARPALERQVRRMLAYRHTLLHDDLALHRRLGGSHLRVAISGASGLIGSALAGLLTTGGHEVMRLVRRAAAGPDEIAWDPERSRVDDAALARVDAVVHLAGAGIADRRWTEARKRLILDSRVRGTRLLAEALARLQPRPAVLVSASAVGIYGDRGDELLDEQSPPGGDFLAAVCRAWEAAAAPAAAAGMRVVHPRFGIVLSPAGGALARMLPPFRAGIGGPLAGGRHWMSAIPIDDVAGALLHCLLRADLAGPVNLAGPEPLTNAAFTKALADVLHRPAVLPVPALALRLAFGELADHALLVSQRVLPRALAGSDYQFRHPDIPAALRFVLGREPAQPPGSGPAGRRG